MQFRNQNRRQRCQCLCCHNALFLRCCLIPWIGLRWLLHFCNISHINPSFCRQYQWLRAFQKMSLSAQTKPKASAIEHFRFGESFMLIPARNEKNAITYMYSFVCFTSQMSQINYRVRLPTNFSFLAIQAMSHQRTCSTVAMSSACEA
jgi:hypothetical protein